MLIYFVRHGQTDWNKALKWQGHSDVELNATGHEQAQAIRRYFVSHRITPSVILSSPLRRAMVTAQCIAKPFALTVAPEQAFRELNLGEFEGKTTEALQAEYGSIFEQWLANYHLDASPGGESIAQAITRMEPALRGHLQLYGENTVIVAHQAILMAMKSALSGDCTPAKLATYKQANFEIDVWDVDQAKIAKRIDIRTH